MASIKTADQSSWIQGLRDMCPASCHSVMLSSSAYSASASELSFQQDREEGKILMQQQQDASVFSAIRQSSVSAIVPFTSTSTLVSSGPLSSTRQDSTHSLCQRLNFQPSEVLTLLSPVKAGPANQVHRKRIRKSPGTLALSAGTTETVCTTPRRTKRPQPNISEERASNQGERLSRYSKRIRQIYPSGYVPHSRRNQPGSFTSSFGLLDPVLESPPREGPLRKQDEPLGERPCCIGQESVMDDLIETLNEVEEDEIETEEDNVEEVQHLSVAESDFSTFMDRPLCPNKPVTLSQIRRKGISKKLKQIGKQLCLGQQGGLHTLAVL